MTDNKRHFQGVARIRRLRSSLFIEEEAKAWLRAILSSQ
jgi:hypothetical protein